MTKPYVATGPEDLIALAPTVLRFVPRDSVVVMTFGRPGRSFHARVGLPRQPRDQDEVAATILQAMKQNHLRRCAVLLYSDDRSAAVGQARRLSTRLASAGIRVVDVLQISGDRYFRVLEDDLVGTGFDLSAHPFTARRVLDGVVVHKSREELAATLVPGADEQASLAEVEEATRARLTQDEVAADRQWLRSTVPQFLPQGEVPDADLPRLLAALMDQRMIDVVWSLIDHGNADAHVALWRHVVRRSPDAFAQAPCCLLAFAAWLAGDGALAWCGLDRCGTTTLPMARMLAELLHAAVPPHLWPGLSAEELSSLRGPAA